MSQKEREDPELEAGDSPFAAGLGREEPPGEEPDRTEALSPAPHPGVEAAMDPQASQYFASLDSSIENLQHRAQQLIDRVNRSRKQGHALMSSFRESLLTKVAGLAEQLEEQLFSLYGLHTELIQQRLQELAEVLGRLGQAKAELQRLCHAMEAAHRDLCRQHEA